MLFLRVPAWVAAIYWGCILTYGAYYLICMVWPEFAHCWAVVIGSILVSLGVGWFAGRAYGEDSVNKKSPGWHAEPETGNEPINLPDSDQLKAQLKHKGCTIPPPVPGTDWQMLWTKHDPFWGNMTRVKRHDLPSPQRPRGGASFTTNVYWKYPADFEREMIRKFSVNTNDEKG